MHTPSNERSLSDRNERPTHVSSSLARHVRWTVALAPALAVGALSGLPACIAFTGVAVTPENRVMAVHTTFALGPWLVVATFLAGYAALLSWGPSVTTVDGLVVQVVAQKLATVVLIGGLLFASREVDRISPTVAP
jgi:hypothetical protein